MFSPRLALVAILLIPTIAQAQRGGGGGGSGGSGGGGGSKDRGTKADYDGMTKESKPGLQLSNRDLEDVNPIKLLVDKRKALKLSDDQTKQFRDLDGKLKGKNEALFKALDSLRSMLRPRGVTPSDEEQLKMTIARNDVMGVVKDIRANYEASVKEALPLLDVTQQATANDLLQKQALEAAEMLKEKLGGRRG